MSLGGLPDVAVLAVAAATGYLLGSLSPATVLARRAGADLRTEGSGNPGATNVGRVLGRRAGVVVAVLDVGKGLLPAAAFAAVLPAAGLLAGLAAVLGHITSPLLRFRGGRGAATAAGAVLGVRPAWALVLLAVWLVVVLVARWVALASVCAALALPLTALAAAERPLVLLWAVGLSGLVLARHRRNLARWSARRRGRFG